VGAGGQGIILAAERHVLILAANEEIAAEREIQAGAERPAEMRGGGDGGRLGRFGAGKGDAGGGEGERRAECPADAAAQGGQILNLAVDRASQRDGKIAEREVALDAEDERITAAEIVAAE